MARFTQSVPVKATGTEINTGTDDAKFATAKAITDSNVAFLSDIPTFPTKIQTIVATGQTDDITDTAFTTTGNGIYKLSFYILDTVADLTAGAVTLNFKFTDDGAARTISSSPVVLTATTGYVHGDLTIRLASGSLTYGITHTGIYGTSAYALYIILERLN